MSSRDGQTWENIQQWAEKGADDSNNLMGLAYGQGRWVCVGGGGWSKETQAGHILVSTDGKEWREVAKYPFRVNPILFLGDRFVAGGPGRQLLFSLDGERWQEGESATLPPELPSWAFWWRAGAAGNGTFIFMGNANKDQKTWWCLTTRDGAKIESFSVDAPGTRGVTFGAEKFVAIDSDAIHTSSDGKTWTAVPEVPSDEFRDVVWSGTAFILNARNATYSSEDGLRWKVFGKPAPGSLMSADEKGLIATSWAGKMYFAKDGTEWKKTGQPLPEMGINKVVYGPIAKP